MKKLKRVSIAMMFAIILALVSPAFIATFSNVISAEAATTVKMNKSELTLYVGDTDTLKISGTTKTVKWSSSKKSVATVTSKGKITAKKAGTATITATVNKKEYTCKVTVKAFDTSTEQTSEYGKVTAISGTKVTFAIGTLNIPSETTSAKPSGTPSAKPSGTPSAKPSGTPSAIPSGTLNNNTTDTASGPSSDSTQGKTLSSEAPELLTLTGKTKTITISDTSILSKQSMQGPNGDSTATNTTADTSSSTAALTDIAVGSILKVTYTSAGDFASIVIIEADKPREIQKGNTSE